MNKTDITEPIINILSQEISDEHSKQYIKDILELMMLRGDLSSIQFNKKKLGKQKYCWTGSVKNWVWEGEHWRDYVSSEGLAFEVLEGLNPDQAWGAWQDYLYKIK